MKKQIAVLMAAATAVTTVAPVLASADVNEYSSSVSEANAKIKAALNERYKNKTEDGINPSNADEVDAYMNSRYAVAIATNADASKINVNTYDLETLASSPYAEATGKSTTKASQIGKEIKTQADTLSNIYIVKDASRVQGLLENLVIGANNIDVKVILVDKGIKDGSAVQTIKNKHYVISENDLDPTEKETKVSLNELAKDLAENVKIESGADKRAGYVKTLKLNGESTEIKKASEVKGEVTKVEVTLTSGKEYTLEENDEAFDLAKPLDKDGKELKIEGTNNAQNVLDQIEGFKFEANKDDKSVTLTLPIGDTDVYEVKDVQASVVELGKIFTNKEGYTKEGADLVNGIVKSRKAIEDEDGINGFNFRNVNYQLIPDGKKVKESGIPAKIEKVGNGYELKYTILVKDVTNGYEELKLQFVIKGDSQKDLAIVLKNLEGKNSVVAGKFTRLQGSNRYETAVAVSEEKFDPESASTVVIAGGEALMDGLSAVPLAAAHNAPILLANPNSGLDDATVKEIKRVCKNLNRKTVYVVGGEKSVPAKAVSQLEAMGAVVERLSGSDRYDTSLEVARNLKTDGVTKDIFIVGGEGAADAMSASPVAATQFEKGKISPILVVPKTGVKKSTREFVATKFDGQNGYVIGGESSVSSDVYRALKSTYDSKKISSLNRVSGSDRFDTNVQLIKKFYAAIEDSKNVTKPDGVDTKLYNNKIAVEGAIFTSGDNKYLVDAQTAGPLAAAKQAPIVLSGAKLTDDQVNLLKNNGELSKVNTDVYQVGGVVSSDVMAVVVDKLDL